MSIFLKLDMSFPVNELQRNLIFPIETKQDINDDDKPTKWKFNDKDCGISPP